MPLSDIAQVTITTLTGGITRAGFGMALILSHKATWVERVRTYSDAAAVGTDFATTTPEYKAASALFSQNPRPEKVMIGRAALAPTQRYDIKVPNVVNSTKYSFLLNGVQIDFTSDPSATNDEIIAGLQAAAAATATAAGFTASVQGAVGSTFLRILGNAAGNWVAVELLDLNFLSLEQNHADPGVATDLDAIALIDNSWYCLITLSNSKALVLAAAAWVEAHGKLYVAATCDSEVATVAFSSATDVAKTLNASAYFRTAPIYHQSSGSFIDAAFAGALLPYDPGSETWKFKTLAGIAATTLTGTWQANIIAKKCNYYYTVAGRNITAEGKVSGDEWIDVIRFRDWLQVRIQERLAILLFNAKKIPYTDPGIALVQAEVTAQLKEGEDVGGLVPGGLLSGDAYVTVPKAANVNPADKAARVLRNVNFLHELAGAIHSIKVNGTITL